VVHQFFRNFGIFYVVPESPPLAIGRLRIARSMRDLWNVPHEVTQEKGGQFVSLKQGWCDTTTPAGKLMITVLGGVAEFERGLASGRSAPQCGGACWVESARAPSSTAHPLCG
jgi:hypothetical protein